jgi:hypothetical protein
MRRMAILTGTFFTLLGMQNLWCAEETSCDQIRNFAEERLHAVSSTQFELNKLQFNCKLLPTSGLQFLIATTPNPIETRLGLWFDREVESIQSAADSVGLRFQSAWIPWDADLLRDQTDLDQRQKQLQEKEKVEKEPGLLLFRADKHPSEAPRFEDLVVLLVPETPTGGIDTKVFCDAVDIVVGETMQGYTIPVVGPNFSGSFASLAKILNGPAEADGSKKACDGAAKLRMISGSATSTQAWQEAFGTPTYGHPVTQYHTMVHDTELLWEIMDTRLSPWKEKNSERPRVAILSESETRYGGEQLSHQPSQRLLLRYPRGISRLRNAYSDQELKAATGGQQQPSFRNLLTFRIFDAGPATDSTPVFAKNQTPLSEDAVVEAIARTLRDEQIDMAGILATDPFDALFIARYLRDACPNVRLFTLDSDLLWVRGAQDFPFTGILAITTYPLMELNQRWTNLLNPQGGPTRKLFPSRASEGIYNATRSLLLGMGSADHHKDSDHGQLAEYFNPFEDCAGGPDAREQCKTPPVWVTVVSREGYWPIAVADPDSSADSQLLSWKSVENQSQLSVGPIPRLWRFLFALLTGFVVFYSACLIASLGRRGQQRALAGWGVWPREEGWLARLCYLSISSLSLAALYAVYTAPMFALSRSELSDYPAVAGASMLLLLVASLAPVLKACLGPHHKRNGKLDAWHYGILAIAGVYVSILIWALLHLFFLPDAQNHERFFFAFRSMHLSSGVAPIAPLLFLLAGFFCWGKVHLTRLALLHDRVPWLPQLGTCIEAEALEHERKQLEGLVRDPLPFHWRTLGAFAIIVLIWTYLASSLRTFEVWPYERLVVLSLAVLYALLFLTWGRIMAIWAKLHLFLESLERHPIRFAFSALPREETWSPIFHASAGKRSYSAEVHVRDGLKVLSECLPPALEEAARKYNHQLEMVLKRATAGLRVPWSAHRDLGERLGEVDKLLIEILQPHWDSSGWETAPAVKPQKQSASSEDQADARPVEASLWPADDPGRVAQAMIAFQIIGYIRYTLHQVRNLIYFVMVGFVLSMVALYSYPFQAPRTITTFITIMFLVFGGGIVLVMAQADRDRILSRITNTRPGALNAGFFTRLITYLGLPLVTVVASQVPSWGRFLFSWVQPALEALK